MPELNVEKYRKRILAEKARLQSAQDRLVNREDGMSDEVSELANFDPNHPGDVGTEMFEREKEVALNENIDSMLAQIEEALAKLDAGTYGRCERCGKGIASARLDTLPYATLCIDCQSYIENAP